MSYQVLARKWRPSTFTEMVGQAHVLKALVNALDQGRLHHAYLFTGTRGVGKTTIARLLAKSLNCEEGISSHPCGVCSSCVDISEGRFVDLIEVDAASRTKVEDTRELLDNVQYSPTRGRFKVYLIDEVHMLSTSSFNALLKTLEEPPEHVKFLLATTDPQKLPVTVLSRCLQFNLKNMSREHIVQHLGHILSVENVPYDEGSLWAIAEAASGSMRDSLSLTDQGIAYGQGQLNEQDIAAMIGTVDLKRVLKLVQALFEKDIDTLMSIVAQIDEHSPDYPMLMTDLMSTLHRIAIAQAAPNAIENNKGDRDAILQLASTTHAEDVHLFYQIAIKAKPEMSFGPSERAGFEMALLRMVAFSQTPAADVGALPTLSSQQPIAETEGSAPPKLESMSAVQHDVEPLTSNGVDENPLANHIENREPSTAPPVVSNSKHTSEPSEQKVDRKPEKISGTPASAWSETRIETEPKVNDAERVIGSEIEPPSASVLTDNEPVKANTTESADDEWQTEATWPEVNLDQNPVFWWQVTVHRLGLQGLTKTLFAHSEWVGFDGRVLSIKISTNYRKIMNDSHVQKLLKVITPWLPGCSQLAFEFQAVAETPQMWADHLVQAAKNKAFEHLQKDPFVMNLINDYQGELIQESAQPNHNPIPQE